MKRLITFALSFAIVACIMTGCRRKEDMNTTDTTTTPTTFTTPPSHNTTPQNTTIPTTGSIPQESTMPSEENSNTEGNPNNNVRSRAHYPTVICESNY